MPYPVALILTMVVEVPIYIVALRVGRILPWPRALVAAVVVNLASHPIAWRLISEDPSWQRFVAVECGVWVVEAALVTAWVRRDVAVVALVALCANAASVLAGMAAWALWW